MFQGVGGDGGFQEELSERERERFLSRQEKRTSSMRLGTFLNEKQPRLDIGISTFQSKNKYTNDLKNWFIMEIQILYIYKKIIIIYCMNVNCPNKSTDLSVNLSNSALCSTAQQKQGLNVVTTLHHRPLMTLQVTGSSPSLTLTSAFSSDTFFVESWLHSGFDYFHSHVNRRSLMLYYYC